MKTTPFAFAALALTSASALAQIPMSKSPVDVDSAQAATRKLMMRENSQAKNALECKGVELSTKEVVTLTMMKLDSGYTLASVNAYADDASFLAGTIKSAFSAYVELPTIQETKPLIRLGADGSPQTDDKIKVAVQWYKSVRQPDVAAAGAARVKGAVSTAVISWTTPENVSIVQLVSNVEKKSGARTTSREVFFTNCKK